MSSKKEYICRTCGKSFEAEPLRYNDDLFHFCEECLNKEDDKTKEPDYKKAYNILMDYWKYIPDDLREEVDRRLAQVGC